MSDKRPPEIEIEIEKDIEKENFTDTQKWGKKNNSVIDSYNNDKSVKNVITKITDNVNVNDNVNGNVNDNVIDNS